MNYLLATEATRDQPMTTTLLDLVRELIDAGATDREVVFAVRDLLKTGQVRIVGEICDEHLLAH